jgi:hypothetical protein
VPPRVGSLRKARGDPRSSLMVRSGRLTSQVPLPGNSGCSAADGRPSQNRDSWTRYPTQSGPPACTPIRQGVRGNAAVRRLANTVTFCDGHGVFFVAISGQFRAAVNTPYLRV